MAARVDVVPPAVLADQQQSIVVLNLRDPVKLPAPESRFVVVLLGLHAVADPIAWRVAAFGRCRRPCWAANPRIRTKTLQVKMPGRTANRNLHETCGCRLRRLSAGR